MGRQAIYDIEHQQLVIMNAAIMKDLDEITDKVLMNIPFGKRFSIENLLVSFGEIKSYKARYVNAAIAMIARKLAKQGKLLICIPEADIDILPGWTHISSFKYQVVDMELEEYYEGGV